MSELDLYTVGEVVIDFIPGQEDESYIRNIGGAPVNVAAAVARNGLKTGFCGKVGADDMGDFLMEKLRQNNVRVICCDREEEAVTTLAFVTLDKEGERRFTFVRKPGADMFLRESDIREDDIKKSTIIHAGSCSLSKEPAASATVRAMSLSHKHGKITSFDVNYRDLMWDGKEGLATKKIMEIMPFIDLLKVSEEEVDMLGGDHKIFDLIEQYNLTLVVKTKGREGAICYFEHAEIFEKARSVKAVDTTGAGDAFWGGFLSSLLREGVKNKGDVTREKIETALKYGTISGGICVQKKGAVESLPTRQEIETYLEDSYYE